MFNTVKEIVKETTNTNNRSPELTSIATDSISKTSTSPDKEVEQRSLEENDVKPAGDKEIVNMRIY